MKILVTGTAGFIGFHLVRCLTDQGHSVVGLDCINHYYEVQLKLDRLAQCGIDTERISYGQVISSSTMPNYRFVKMNLEDREALPHLFEEERFDKVCNLAAQAGVRYSFENPFSYIESNIVGYVNILECCRTYHVPHLVYASSSSVYGANTKVPFSEQDRVDHPVSLYAATKKSNELMAYAYAHLYGFQVTGLRFFSVYGPWGRPDMASQLFAHAMMRKQPIEIFNNGDLLRDFTYVADIVEGVSKILLSTEVTAGKSDVYNIGCQHPVRLMDFISILEECLGVEAIKHFRPMQPGDVYQTYADCDHLEQDFHYHPQTPLKTGLGHFVEWFKTYYGYGH